jgi:8-oxo-dGTP diphosphatase
MELCDVVDELGNRTGQVVARGTKLASDEFYLVVHVWIKDEHANYLIQQRALHLESGPGVWATTVGYVLAGEESLNGAIREVKEELGIQLLPSQLRLFNRHAMENRVEDIWLAEIPSNSMGVPALGPEVAAWKWISKGELEEMVSRREFFKYSYLSDILKEQ